MEEGCEDWDPLVIHDFFVDVLEVVQHSDVRQQIWFKIKAKGSPIVIFFTLYRSEELLYLKNPVVAFFLM